MKKKVSKIIICASLFALTAAGTCMLSYADTEETAAQTEEGRERPENDGSQRAKVVSLSGTTLTVYLEETPEFGGEGMQDGQTPPEKPEGEEGSTDDATPPEKPEDGTEPPERPEGETAADGTEGNGMPEGGMGQGGHMANYSEETTALTVTSETTVTEGMEQTSVSLSSLEEGDEVRLVLDGTTVVSISIMDMQQPPESEASAE